MARRVIGGQVPESPGTLSQQTRDFDSPAKQLDDHNANYEELYALMSALTDVVALLGPGAAGVLVTDAAPGSGAITNYAPAGFGATTNRLDITANDLGTQLNDLPIGTDNQIVRVRNKGLVGDLTLNNAVGGSTAAKRFSGVGNVDLPPGDSIEIRYYAGSVNRWIM